MISTPTGTPEELVRQIEATTPDDFSTDEINVGIFDALYRYLTGECKGLPPVPPARPDRDESLYHRPYTLDLSSNPTLPPLERSLQSVLLRVIVEFGGIARDLDFLSSRPKRDGDFLSRMSDAWGESHTCAFTQAIEANGAKWV